MLEPVKKVELREGMGREDITDKFAGKTIDITLSDGLQITVEFFERDPDGAINISAGGERLQVLPVASNVVKVKAIR